MSESNFRKINRNRLHIITMNVINESAINENFSRAISYELVVFADSLVPSENYIKDAKKAFKDVTESIKRDPAFSVNHCLLSGSVGKKTSVLRPDVDGIVFLNKKELPLTHEIDAIIDLLKSKAGEFGIVRSNITRGSKTVTMLFNNGIEMDLLPACNFSHQDVYKQYLKVLERIKSYPENYSSYSSSLGDIQLQFLKDQQGPTHQLIRLVKYWYKSLTLDAEIYGGSYLMEILCVTVCKESETKNSLFTNFKATLQKIYKIDTLRVAFLLKKNINNKLTWRLLSADELEQHKDAFSPLILERSRFIIDPSNPYNDLFNPKNLTDTVVDKLKNHAKEMLERVEMLETFESNVIKTVTTVSETDNDNNVEVKLHIDKIFEPHSISLKDHRYADEGIPNEIIYHVSYKNSMKLKSSIIDCVNATFFVENKEAKKVSKTMLTNLESLIRTKARLVEFERKNKRDGREEKWKKYIYSYGLPDVADICNVKEAVETLIEQNKFVSFRESSSEKCHQKCDVTLYVPYVCKDNNLALQFSMKWTNKLEEEHNNFNGKKCCVVS